MARKKATMSDLMNNMTYKIIYERLHNMALNMFEWEGLPETIKPEFIERTLYAHGKALFFNDPLVGFMCLPCSASGKVNIYGEPQSFNATGFNYNKRYTLEKSVLIKNNMIQAPTQNFISVYAAKLYSIERALDTNVNAQKTPYVIACDQNSLLTATNMYNQINDNEPVIFVDKNMNLDTIKILETVAPFVCDKLADYRHDVTNEVLTFLGIDNANTDKRERLVSDEVTSNNEYIDFSALYMLNTRQQAVKEINAKYNLSISVKLREAGPNEQIHNDTQTDQGK